jgi:hypothetical protein
MPFRQPPKLPDFQELKTVFIGAREQIKNHPVYQTIVNLLDANARSQDIINGKIQTLQDIIDNTVTVLGTLGSQSNAPFAFDGIDGIDGETIIIQQGGSSTSSEGVWQPLTNGDVASPELIFALGDVIMVEVFY